jgi:hypothetical protein
VLQVPDQGQEQWRSSRLTRGVERSALLRVGLEIVKRETPAVLHVNELEGKVDERCLEGATIVDRKALRNEAAAALR